MKPIKIELVLEKETKGTYRYKAVKEGASVTHLYIKKSAFPASPEGKIQLEVQ